MTQLLAPLVGAHFRPPAKLILESLPAGAGLRLVPEPDNAYDEKAIKVLVATSAIPEGQYDKLRASLPGMGSDLDDILAGTADCVVAGTIHLGYIADSDGKVCVQGGLNGNREVAALVRDDDWDALRASLAFGPDGKPLVAVASS